MTSRIDKKDAFMTEKDSGTLLQMILEEHREISSQIADLIHFWNEVYELGQGPKYEEMAWRVQTLRKLLAAHFTDEERGGYPAPVLQQTPHFCTQAEELRQQHTQFLNSLDDYIDRLRRRESGFHCRTEVRTEYDDFLKQLHEHEAAETRIVTEAVRKESGTLDCELFCTR